MIAYHSRQNQFSPLSRKSSPVSSDNPQSLVDTRTANMNSSLLSCFLLMVSMATVARAGFRCTLGNWACTASCVTLGQTSGICDGEGECQCSEKSIRYVNVSS